jgi:hypothetical protein
MKKESAIEKLARMVKLGFDDVHRVLEDMQNRINKRFDEHDRRFDILDLRGRGIDDRISRLEDQMKQVKVKLQL